MSYPQKLLVNKSSTSSNAGY